jgi:hypothetical protein
MASLAILNAYTMRVSLSIAITEMVVHENFTVKRNNSDDCDLYDQHIRHFVEVSKCLDKSQSLTVDFPGQRDFVRLGRVHSGRNPELVFLGLLDKSRARWSAVAAVWGEERDGNRSSHQRHLDVDLSLAHTKIQRDYRHCDSSKGCDGDGSGRIISRD